MLNGAPARCSGGISGGLLHGVICLDHRSITASPQRMPQSYASAPGQKRCLAGQLHEEKIMSINDRPTGSEAGKQKGGIGYVLLWFLGVPIPLLILFALLRGCA